MNTQNRARDTLPPGFFVGASTTPDAGEGVFYRGKGVRAREPVVYGPYEDVISDVNYQRPQLDGLRHASAQSTQGKPRRIAKKRQSFS